MVPIWPSIAKALDLDLSDKKNEVQDKLEMEYSHAYSWVGHHINSINFVESHVHDGGSTGETPPESGVLTDHLRLVVSIQGFLFP